MTHKIVARKFRPKVQTAVGVPIAVLFATTPGRWRIDGTSGPPGFLLVPGAGSRSSLFSDVWKVREVFLGLETQEEFLGFLNEVGCFLPSSASRNSAVFWELDSLRRWQTVFREFLRRSPETWREFVVKRASNPNEASRRILAEASNIKVQFQWHRPGESYKPNTPFTAVLKTFDVVSAILATIYLDRLRGAMFAFCERHDCGELYEITSKHKRKYCSHYCAHFASLRRSRERKARAAQL